MGTLVSKIKSFTKYFFITILVLLVLVFVVLQLPPVQTRIGQEVTTVLAKDLNTTLRVGKVRIGLFSSVTLSDIYVEDQQQDTLLYAGKLEVDIALFKLLSQQVNIESIELNNAVAHVNQNADTVFNFQFLIDHFVGNTPKDTTKPPSAWQISISDIALNNIQATFTDAVSGLDLAANFSNLSLAVISMDINNLALDVETLSLQNLALNYLQNPRPKVESVPTFKTKPLLFPDLGIDLLVRKLYVENSNITYNDNNFTPTTAGFDYAHMTLSQVNLNIQDIDITDTLIAATLNQLSLQEKCGLEIRSLRAYVSASNQAIIVDGLELLTPNSHVKTNTTLSYPSFWALEDFLNEVTISSQVGESYVSMADVAFFAPILDSLSFLKNPSAQKVYLSGKINGTVNNFNFEQLSIAINSTNTHVLATGSMHQVANVDSLRYNVQLTQVTSSYTDLLAILADGELLPEGLNQFGEFNITGLVAGTLQDIVVDSLQLNTASNTSLLASLTASEFLKPDQSTINLTVHQLNTNYQDVQAFTGEIAGVDLAKLGTINYSGSVKGTLLDMTAQGQLKTAIGSVNHNLDLLFDKTYSTADYAGTVDLVNLKLGTLLGDTSIGLVSLAAAIDGSGFNPATMQTELKLLVDKLEYYADDYQGLALNASLNNNLLQLDGALKHKNITFDLKGSYNLDTLNPNIILALNLDTINLQALHLYPTQLSASGILNCNVTGTSDTNINGSIVLTNVNISDSLYDFHEDLLTLNLNLKGQHKMIDLQSDMLTANIEGDFDPVLLPDLALGILNEHYPIKKYVDFDDDSTRFTNQNISANILAKNPIPLTRVFLPLLQSLPELSLSASINGQTRSLNLSCTIPVLMYDSITVEDVSLQIKPDTEGYKLTGLVNNIIIKDSAFLQRIEVTTIIGNNSLKASIGALNDSADYRLLLSGLIERKGDTVSAAIIPPFYLNSNQWEVKNNNEVIVTNSEVKVRDLVLSHEGQSIGIEILHQTMLTLNFNQFEIAEITSLIGYRNNEIVGKINGYVTIDPLAKELDFITDIGIEGLRVDTIQVGNVALKAKTEGPLINVNAMIDGPNDFSLSGSVNLAKNFVNLNVIAPHLNLNLADPFLPGIIEASTGSFSLNATVVGDMKKPSIIGKLSINNKASTYVNYLSGRYSLTGQNISFNDKEIVIPGIKFFDPANREASLSGNIKHTNYANPILDLTFNTKGFMFMNTEETSDAPIYGSLFMGMNATVKGSIDLPKVNVTAKTLDGTSLFLLPISQEESLQQEHFVIFVTPEELEAENIDSVLSVQKKYVAKMSGVDLTLNLEVDKAAKFEILMDPISGDKLAFNGTGNLVVQIMPAGDISVAGTFILSGGKYIVSYNGKAQKEFTIKEGGRLDFAGDPLNAKLNISAIYTTRTSTYSLVANQTSLSDAEKKAAQDKSTVLVYLNISGSLSEPDLSFDIELPPGQSNAITSSVARRLAQIRADETELNKQVFGLLLFNSFIVSNDNATSNLGKSGENIALNSVSKLISSQLNNLADKVQAINIDFNLDSYQSDNLAAENIVTELGVQLSKGLANERVVISIDGNVNLENAGAQSEGVALTGIAGDFVLEYKLTKDGRYRVSVFQSSDYDMLTETNTYKTGVGINFQQSFGDPIKKLKKQNSKTDE